MTQETVLGIIGGSGFYEIADDVGADWARIHSPWGEPSDEVFIGAIEGVKVVFLPRHGRSHRVSPSHINYRANIDILKRAGVTDIISLSACGSFREDLAPGTFVLVDQFVDRTYLRETSFFGDGVVAHVSMAEPVCPRLLDALEAGCREVGVRHVRGGVYLAIEGPQFSTRAESRIYKNMGCDVVGMTNMPEAKLAREAEMPYATVAMVTDFDAWRAGAAAASVIDVVTVMHENAHHGRALLKAVAPKLGPERTACPIGADRALDDAIITPRQSWDPSMTPKLDAVAGRILNKAKK